MQAYTIFGYDGVETCRRIKDELVAALEKEGVTWGEVVAKAIAELSLKEEKPARLTMGEAGDVGEGSVAQLIEEAKELKRMLDRLGGEDGYYCASLDS